MKIEKQWEWIIGDFLSVKPLKNGEFFGVLSNSMKKLTVYDAIDRDKCWSFVPESKGDIIGNIYDFDSHVGVGVRCGATLEKMKWYSISLGTGVVSNIKGMRFGDHIVSKVDKFLLIKKAGKLGVFDLEAGKTVAIKKDDLPEGDLIATSRGKYLTRKEPCQNEGSGLAVGSLNFTSKGVNFAPEKKLDSEEAFRFVHGGSKFFLGRGKDAHHKYFVFDWDGCLVGVIDLEDIDSEFNKRDPLIYCTDNNYTVFLYRDADKGKASIVAYSMENLTKVWELSLDEAIYSGVYTFAGRFLLNPLGLGVLVKEREAGIFSPRLESSTRVISLTTGDVEEIVCDIGENIFWGKKNRVYYSKFNEESNVLGCALVV